MQHRIFQPVAIVASYSQLYNSVQISMMKIHIIDIISSDLSADLQKKAIMHMYFHCGNLHYLSVAIFLIQNHLEQYNECTCNATGVENPNCIPDTTTKHICQDEAMITITLNSQDLPSALSVELDTTYYLISKFDEEIIVCSRP